MTKRDYYEVLGISKNAQINEIKRAYRVLAKEHHPDMNKDNIKESEERFKEISEAYAVLCDVDKRARYDRFGHSGLNGYSSEDIFSGVDLGDILRDLGFGGGFGGIFDSFFGGGRHSGYQSGPKRGSDIRYDLKITLEDVAFGLDTTIGIRRMEVCDVCEGSGAKSGTEKEICSNCNGTGQMRESRRTPFGQFTTVGNCNSCKGTGKIIKDPCSECNGSGMLRRECKIDVKVPAGVDDGLRLRLSGEGEPGSMGGPSGDLYVILHVQAHDMFERFGNDILCEAPISFAQAALGAEIDVPTLSGDNESIKISQGTQTDTVIKLKGKGIPSLRGYGNGDQHVRLKVVTPTKLSERQKELLREFEDQVTKDESKKSILGKIIDGVKDTI
ncbi:MAG: molecular chaperone DnaJ [Halobacteriota archaeon]|nr:molecular chaperone DnaJ [Halobacteriota archaeon]